VGGLVYQELRKCPVICQVVGQKRKRCSEVANKANQLLSISQAHQKQQWCPYIKRLHPDYCC